MEDTTLVFNDWTSDMIKIVNGSKFTMRDVHLTRSTPGATQGFVNEVRDDEDQDPLEHGDVILNPAYLQWIQMQHQWDMEKDQIKHQREMEKQQLKLQQEQAETQKTQGHS